MCEFLGVGLAVGVAKALLLAVGGIHCDTHRQMGGVLADIHQAKRRRHALVIGIAGMRGMETFLPFSVVWPE